MGLVEPVKRCPILALAIFGLNFHGKFHLLQAVTKHLDTVGRFFIQSGGFCGGIDQLITLCHHFRLEQPVTGVDHVTGTFHAAFQTGISPVDIAETFLHSEPGNIVKIFFNCRFGSSEKGEKFIFELFQRSIRAVVQRCDNIVDQPLNHVLTGQAVHIAGVHIVLDCRGEHLIKCIMILDREVVTAQGVIGTELKTRTGFCPSSGDEFVTVDLISGKRVHHRRAEAENDPFIEFDIVRRRQAVVGIDLTDENMVGMGLVRFFLDCEEKFTVAVRNTAHCTGPTSAFFVKLLQRRSPTLRIGNGRVVGGKAIVAGTFPGTVIFVNIDCLFRFPESEPVFDHQFRQIRIGNTHTDIAGVFTPSVNIISADSSRKHTEIFRMLLEVTVIIFGECMSSGNTAVAAEAVTEKPLEFSLIVFFHSFHGTPAI